METMKKTAYAKDKKCRVNFRVSPEMRDWLQKEADRNGMTYADYCRTVLESYMYTSKVFR